LKADYIISFFPLLITTWCSEVLSFGDRTEMNRIAALKFKHMAITIITDSSFSKLGLAAFKV
jgi:hypothetical protein